MNIGLNGKVAIVTGAARGIGRGIALQLARAGVSVCVADLNSASAKHVVDEIGELKRDAIALELDVTHVESVERCVAQAIERFRHVDILVNNAGVFQRRLGLELNEDGFSECMDVNVTGMWRMVRALVPHLRAQAGGRIINIASVGGRRGVGFAPAYCASKAAVINLTQSLALALSSDNITVNTVCPGAVATAMQEEIKAALRGQSASQCNELPAPLAGPLTADDIGHAVVFFASDCARNITGQALNVDRGELMN